MGYPIIPTGGFSRLNPYSPDSPPETLHGHFFWAIQAGGTGANTQQGAINNLVNASVKGELVVFDGANVVLQSPGPVNWVLSRTNSTATGLIWVSPSAGGGGISAHASSHQNGGGDEVATATAAANAIPKAGAGGTLSVNWVPQAILASPTGGGLRGLMPSPSANTYAKVLFGRGYASPDHTALLNKGTNTHTQIDTHIAATTSIHGLSSSPVGVSDTQTITNKIFEEPFYFNSAGSGNVRIRRHPTEDYRTLIQFVTAGSELSPNDSPNQFISISTSSLTGTEAAHPTISAVKEGDTGASVTHLQLFADGAGSYVRVKQDGDSSFRRVVTHNDERLLRVLTYASPSEDISSVATDGYTRYHAGDNTFYFYDDSRSSLLSMDSTTVAAYNTSPNLANNYFAFPGEAKGGDFTNVMTSLYGYSFPYRVSVVELTAVRLSPVAPSSPPIIQVRVNGSSVATVPFSGVSLTTFSSALNQEVAVGQSLSFYAQRAFGIGHVLAKVRRVYSP